MKKFAFAFLALSACISAAEAQDRSSVYSSPAIPAREALDRLNLKLGWTTVIPTDSLRDGLATLQTNGRLLLAQTKSGLVTAIEAETGRAIWRTQVGRAYQPILPLAFNRKHVFVINGTTLYGLDRESGAVRWQVNLPGGVSAPPLADEFQIYIGLGTGRLLAYLLPQPEGTGLRISRDEEERQYAQRAFSDEPVLAWDQSTQVRLEWMPVVGRVAVVFATPGGRLLGVDKFPLKTTGAPDVYRFQLADEPILAPPAQYEDLMYVPSQDANVYAVEIDSGRLTWRYTAGAAILRQPVPTEKDVYVVAEQQGLTRLDRSTGEPVWRLPAGRSTISGNREVTRFLAANPKFVYGSDPSGRLIVLDRATGLTLSTYAGTRDYTLALSNAVTDRIYLGANNGLLICLHDREYEKAYRHSKQEERTVDPRMLELEGKLSKLITDPGAEPVPLSTLLKTFLEKGQGIKYVLSANAFREAGVPAVEDKLVAMPRVVVQQPVADVLKRILDQVDATYRLVEDTVLIYPKPTRKSPAP